MDIGRLFGPGGALAADPKYEHRPQQEEMARAVARALDEEGRVVIEAGTGVGKSLAYLLPGALWAVTSGRRLLVSTYTRALQEQLLEKELPAAAAILQRLGLNLRYAMLQGSDNYLCAQRLSKARAEPELMADRGGRLVEELAQWALTAQSGHRSSLPCLVPQSLWGRLSRDPDLCLGPAGPYWGACLYRKDRERAERADILVVNHALLLSGTRLPPYDALVIDEAHNLEEAAVSRYGVSVSSARVARLLEDLRAAAKDLPDLGPLLDESGDEMSRFFIEIAKSHGRAAAGAEPGGRLLSETERFSEPASLASLEKALLSWLAEEAGRKAAPASEETERRLLHGRIAALRADLSAILGEHGGEELARWIEWSAAGVELKSAPLETGPRLAEGLFSRGIPVVATSATLSSGLGLGAFARQIGLEGARELALDSPFDYPSQAALLVMDDLPPPSDDEKYASALAAQCRKIIAAVPGGVFILFSSWKSLRAVHAKLKRRVKGRPLWVQGSAGSDALLSHFAEAGNAVLLGVDTFWQGVDVPGEALSCVVLAKLPFPSYGSPIEEARRRWCDAMGRSYFDSWSLPKAVMKFRQGFGRLIRSETDRGAVVVLDSRILHRGYGSAFLESLPRCRRLESIEELGAFFSPESSLR